MAPVRKTDERLADPELEGLLDEEEQGTQVPDDERVVPSDVLDHVVEDDERDVG